MQEEATTAGCEDRGQEQGDGDDWQWAATSLRRIFICAAIACSRRTHFLLPIWPLKSRTADPSVGLKSSVGMTIIKGRLDAGLKASTTRTLRPALPEHFALYSASIAFQPTVLSNRRGCSPIFLSHVSRRMECYNHADCSVSVRLWDAQTRARGQACALTFSVSPSLTSVPFISRSEAKGAVQNFRVKGF